PITLHKLATNMPIIVPSSIGNMAKIIFNLFNYIWYNIRVEATLKIWKRKKRRSKVCCMSMS
ncbi:MAG: hypothetical protein KJN80_07480, partial [Deltaproteobacteria bacterium]|nr:hypothetical protein [Deltaproteobacteria bacterium]